MKVVTNDYKENIKLNGRQIDAIISYTIDNEVIELGNEELNSVTPSFEGNILKSAMKQLIVDSNEEIPVNTEINCKFGVKIHEPYTESFDIKGNTIQDGTPTPSEPITITTKTGDITETINNNPYQFNLGNIELCKIDSYQDKIYKNDNKWYLHKEIGKMVLNGTENWQGSSPRFWLGLEDYDSGVKPIICSHFVDAESWSTHTSTNNTIVLYKDSNWSNARLSINDNSFSSMSDFTTWLTSNNVTVYYPLSTPIETEITNGLLLKQLNLVSEEYEYINYGNYIVKEVEKQEDTNSWKATCYDKMLYSMKDYESMNITYPITIRNYINTLCNHIGLTFKNANDVFANYDKQINAELYLDAQGNSLNYTFRDVLDELAQVTASTICLDENDQLEIRYLNNTGETIDEESLKDINVNFSESIKPINTIVLSRSGGSDKISLSQPVDLPNADKNSIVIADNQIMNFNDRNTYMSDILNKLYGLEYYLNDYVSTGITYLDLCDKYNVQIGEETYNCVMLNDEVVISNGLVENIHTDLMEEEETDYSKTDKTDRKINQTYLIVDKQNQTIESVVSNVSVQDAKISQITQTVDEINSKISDVIDITVSGESNFATFTIENVNTSEPIQIKVKPITDNISYLYPRSNLYPSNTLYSTNRRIRFHNIGDNTDIDYELPDDLLYYNNEIYDEFYLDYDSHTCQVTKRCKYNADGTVGVLTTPQINSYSYPAINLQDGDYVLSLLGYEYGYLFVRLMAKNVYTTQFYTKVETDSRINQKADQIEIGVSQTLSNYSTINEMNAAINVKANEINQTVSQKVGKNEIVSSINQTSETIKINASKINLTGYVTFSELEVAGMTTINGSNITTGTINADLINTGTLSANRISGGSITASSINLGNNKFKVDTSGNLTSTAGTIAGWNIDNDGLSNNYGYYIKKYTRNINNKTYNYGFTNVYTMSDFMICQQILLGNFPAPPAGSNQFKHYNPSGSGTISSLDLLIIQNILES